MCNRPPLVQRVGKAVLDEPMTLHLRAYLFALVAILFLAPAMASAATLGFSPLAATVGAGASFTETMIVTSADQTMNAISGNISFPPDLLQVASITKANSVLSLWAQEPVYSNTEGTISFSGIVPNPGFIGSRGQVLTIQFRARKAGTGAILISPSSEVLANDGNGTNILAGIQSAAVTVSSSAPQAAPSFAPSSSSIGLLARITSSTHPSETSWYRLSHAVFDWTNAQGVTAVRLGYDSDPDGKPSVLYADPISHKELDLEDGVWYFYVQERDTSGWGPVSTYRVQIDTKPPRQFDITFLNGTTTTGYGSTIPIQFATTDDLSGIDHYSVNIDGKESVVDAGKGSKPYAISGDIGTHTLLVRAYDKAGNYASTEEAFTVTESDERSLFAFGWLAVNYLTLILVALAVAGTLLFGAWYIHVHFSAYRQRLNRQLGLTHAHVHKEFDSLKQALTEEILTLEKVKSVRALTREEERLVARFKRLLDTAERSIEKDIEELPR